MEPKYLARFQLPDSPKVKDWEMKELEPETTKLAKAGFHFKFYYKVTDDGKSFLFIWSKISCL